MNTTWAYPKHPKTQVALNYAESVVAGRILACKWVKLACNRHLKDLDRSETDEFPYYFDPVASERALSFLSRLPHVKGEWRGKPVKLEPWQCFIVSSLFGWRKQSDGYRRFRTASVYVPRKNGKSLLAGGIGLYLFVGDGEPGAEIYSLATTIMQAWACWKPARDMVELLPKLKEQAGIRVYGGKNPNAPVAALVREDSSVFKPLTGCPGDGQSPSGAILDELHEWTSDDGLQTMRTGMGARRQPMLFIISTAGVNLSGPCIDDWRDCEKLLQDLHTDETKFAIIYTLDEGDDWTSLESLKKANPNYGISINADGIRNDQEVAARDVTKQAHFKTKHLNLFVSGSNAWLNIEKWAQCEMDLALEDFRGERAWVSIDAASKTDLFALVIVFRREGKTYVFTRAYLPEETARMPENKKYLDWAEQGWLTLTPGARTDQIVVEEQLREWSLMFAIQSVAFDPREMNQFALRVSTWASFPLIEIPQSPAMLSAAYKELEALVNTGTIVFQRDPCLRWQASNCQLKEARGGGPVKLWFVTKPRYQDKIDAVVAIAMALSRQMLDQGDDSTGGISIL